MNEEDAATAEQVYFLHLISKARNEKCKESSRRLLACAIQYLKECKPIPHPLGNYLAEALQDVLEGVPYLAALNLSGKQGRAVVGNHWEIASLVHTLVADKGMSISKAAAIVAEHEKYDCSTDAVRKIHSEHRQELEDLDRRTQDFFKEIDARSWE